jgi:anti-sigma regulatory factor (Ser/Thr protein kinase)
VIPSPSGPGPATRHHLDISLAPQPSAPAVARRRLDDLRGEVPPERLEDLRLVVSELVANAVLHAGLHPAQRIGVRLRLCPDHLRVEVEDPGRGFRPRPARGPDAPDGRGLFIVARLARDWGVARGERTVVWAELSLRG